ncbi:hypothetical protein Mapa_005285 [Marchantia paleacea]|nr:hypothetical protein Mapa_005285 [Marchantia paleacea]
MLYSTVLSSSFSIQAVKFPSDGLLLPGNMLAFGRKSHCRHWKWRGERLVPEESVKVLERCG